MATIWSKLSKKGKVLAVIGSIPMPFTGLYVFSLDPEQEKIKKEKKVAKEKALFRNFRMEVKSGFWCNKISFIQREKPLTDEEMELMYKDEK